MMTIDNKKDSVRYVDEQRLWEKDKVHLGEILKSNLWMLCFGGMTSTLVLKPYYTFMSYTSGLSS